ncbi:pyruvate kinase [Echinicola shivajiensis]|uniref:pyruvate kinase n=1 Tax=Echinicola shivajiensis TaxID=1035916 RepID=UPI001BFC69CB|nr:pyruvate kinase [Echinicola shivajiensis]
MDTKVLVKELSEILAEIIGSETFIDNYTQKVHPYYQLSAKNLMRYLILRNKDLRKYHGPLSDLGVSSLRSAEGYVYSNLFNVVKNLHLILNTPFHLKYDLDSIGYTKSFELIRLHANSLFNETKKEHFTKIMVTLPDESVEDKDLIKDMILSGMEIARINLSHGNKEMWKKMIANIRAAEKETGRKINIYMDLSGPKLRTAKIEYISKKGKSKKSMPVQVGEQIILAKKEDFHKGSKPDKKQDKEEKVIRVLLNEVVDDAKIGDSILFDDGMVKGIVVDKKEHHLKLELTECHKSKIGSHKGINLPQTQLNLPALTKKDEADLPFVCQYADILGYSFVRTAKDVEILYRELEKYQSEHLGIVFKIENREAFEHLPEILIKGMERDEIGVMIARGDLAVEIGFERISEVQNEILWLCEAAHIPVIWATQVLENLAKTGIPTRAEISDVTLSVQAECVMLNKGPNILHAIRVLKDILSRMEGHTRKKKNAMRALNVATQFVKKQSKGD